MVRPLDDGSRVAMLGARRESDGLLVIATCRSAEVTKGEGLAKVIAGAAGTTSQALVFAARDVVGGCSGRVPGAALPGSFASPTPCRDYPPAMTGGTAVAIAVIDDLESRGMIRAVDVGWQLSVSVGRGR